MPQALCWQVPHETAVGLVALQVCKWREVRRAWGVGGGDSSSVQNGQQCSGFEGTVELPVVLRALSMYTKGA